MDATLVRTIIDKKEDFLRRNLILSSSVIEKLRQMDVIGEFTKKQMMVNDNKPERQLTLLLTSLKSRGITSFHSFINVLRMTLHGWIADEILDSTIETNELDKDVGASKSVRIIMNKAIEEEHINTKFHYRPVCLDGHEYPVVPNLVVQRPVIYTLPGNKIDEPEVVEAPRRHRSMYQDRHAQFGRDNEYDEYKEFRYNYRKEKSSKYGRMSPVAHIPENLRDLQRVFENETVTTTKSIGVLRQEELTIKALLHQNQREQQEMLTKQEALTEIKDKMKQINKQATHLYKPQPDERETRNRLRHLQRIPWTSDN